MQLNGLNHLTFPPPADAATSNNALETGTRPRGQREAPVAGPVPGVVYTPSAVAAEVSGVESQTDLDALSLEQLITLGKSKGVFTQITYSKGSVFSGQQGGVQMDTGTQFVDSAVNIMRDFQAGMAALKLESPQEPSRKAHFWDAGLQGLKQAVGRLSAHA